MDDYNRAIKLMNKKRDYLTALRLLAKYGKTINSAHEPFRWYNNVGICLMSLGEMELARKYFQKAVSLNTNYQIPKNNLKNYDKPEIIDSLGEMGKQRLFASVLKDTEFPFPELETCQIVHDAPVFLNYLLTHPVPLSQKRRFINFRDVLQINKQFTKPDGVHPFGDKRFLHNEEWQMPKVNFLKIISLVAGFAKDNGKYLTVTSLGGKFIGLSCQKQW